MASRASLFFSFFLFHLHISFSVESLPGLSLLRVVFLKARACISAREVSAPSKRLDLFSERATPAATTRDSRTFLEGLAQPLACPTQLEPRASPSSSARMPRDHFRLFLKRESDALSLEASSQSAFPSPRRGLSSPGRRAATFFSHFPQTLFFVGLAPGVHHRLGSRGLLVVSLLLQKKN